MARDIQEVQSLREEELALTTPLLAEEELRVSREKTIARLRLLWERRKNLARLSGIGLVIATMLAFIIPKRYTSTVRLMPPDQTSGQGAAMLAALTGRVGGSLAGMAENALGIKTTGDLFVGVLQSDTVEDHIIHKYDLQKIYRDRYIEDARADLKEHTGISNDPKTGIISVRVIDGNPVRAAAIADDYAGELNWVMTHLSTSSAHRERVFLDQRLDEVKSDLESDEKQFSRFASQKGAIDIPEQGKAMVAAAATLQGELIAAQSELESLRQIYTDSNVRVRSMQARVTDLHSALEKIGGEGADENSSVSELYPSLKELPLLGVQYADLLRRTKVDEAVFEALTQQAEMTKIEEAKEIPSVKVLDPPQVPDEKSFPPRLLLMCLGLFSGLIVGAAWILGSSAWGAVDSSDPRKLMAQQVWADVHASLPWSHGNGASGSIREKTSGERQSPEHRLK